MYAHWHWLTIREPVVEVEGQITENFYQVAKVDAGFFAWHFRLLDENGNQIASIDRAFRGIGREVRGIIRNINPSNWEP